MSSQSCHLPFRFSGHLPFPSRRSLIRLVWRLVSLVSSGREWNERKERPSVTGRHVNRRGEQVTDEQRPRIHPAYRSYFLGSAPHVGRDEVGAGGGVTRSGMNVGKERTVKASPVHWTELGSVICLTYHLCLLARSLHLRFSRLCQGPSVV